MLTGRQLFGGETVAEVIAAVIKDAPDLNALPANTPPGLRRLLERCLERDPKLRLRDIGEARIALTRADEPRDVVSSPAARSAGRVLLLALGVLGIAAAAGMAGWIVEPGAPAAPVRRFDLPQTHCRCPECVVRAGWQPDRVHQGWAVVSSTHSPPAWRPISAPCLPTRTNLFWSHDSQTIGFAAESTIRTVPVTGGTPFVVCRIPASGRIMGAPLAARQHHRVCRVAGERLPRAGDGRHARAARGARFRRRRSMPIR